MGGDLMGRQRRHAKIFQLVLNVFLTLVEWQRFIGVAATGMPLFLTRLRNFRRPAFRRVAAFVMTAFATT
ncbi:hypothetical protein D3C80_1519420 [compost metagenome]